MVGRTGQQVFLSPASIGGKKDWKLYALGNILRQCRKFSPLHIQTLDLNCGFRTLINLDGCILLFLKEQ